MTARVGMMKRLIKNFSHNHEALIGKRLNKNVFSRSGTLCLTADVILTEEHLNALYDLGVVIEENDVDSDTEATTRLVDDAVLEVKHIFYHAKHSDQLFVRQIKHKVVPLIHTLIHKYSLSHLLTALQSKDDYTFRHSIAVGALATLIGEWLHVKKDDLEVLTTASILHDIGKMKIDSEILLSTGPLSNDQFREMKEHTVLGFDMIQSTPGLGERHALVALRHHERWDGSGYPYGLNGHCIDFLSRIVAVADVFHAMSSKRPYKDPLPFYKVIREMYYSTFGSFDPNIILTFTQKIMNSLIGSEVELSNGQIGKIIRINPSDLPNPLVQTKGRFIDLSMSPMYIDKIV